MRVGVDLDGVVVDFFGEIVKFYNMKYRRNLKVEGLRGYNIWEYGIGRNREEAFSLMDEFYDSEFFSSIPLLIGAENVLKGFSKNEGFDVITSRPEKLRGKTEKFLMRHFDKNFRLVFSGEFNAGLKKKSELCRELGLDVFVEDCLDYAIDCARTCERVFLMNQPWNQGRLPGNVARVNDWYEISEILGARK
ncbi:MAG: hypothetical protein Q8L29_01780 [archaeon]|nr:hypothetical protein [archaeon]